MDSLRLAVLAGLALLGDLDALAAVGAVEQDADDRVGGAAGLDELLGGAGGLLATDGAAWYCPAPPGDVVSTVGAGDSATAGYLVARALEEAPADRLARALAYGTAAVGLPGTTIPRPDQVRIDASTIVRL